MDIATDIATDDKIERMARVIVEIIEKRGSCIPSDLVEHGFRDGDLADHFEDASLRALRRLGKPPLGVLPEPAR